MFEELSNRSWDPYAISTCCISQTFHDNRISLFFFFLIILDQSSWGGLMLVEFLFKPMGSMTQLGEEEAMFFYT